jgi:hypothetical protein
MLTSFSKKQPLLFGRGHLFFAGTKLDPSDVGRLVAFGTLQKIELHSLALIQGTVTVLLNS